MPNNNPQLQNRSSQGQISITQHTYSGIIPDADSLAKYEKACPGAADRIITMAEEQLRHRHELEKLVTESSVNDGRRGVVFAFILGFTTIICGTAIAILGHNITGTIFGGVGLASIIGTFIYGTRLGRRQQNGK
jgi:uncharacterized membrane protein